MASAADILLLLPEVAAIGQHKLQVLCDEWLGRPIARKYGFAQLNVTRDLMLEILMDGGHAWFARERAFIPVDELLGYIIDEHFSDAAQRRQLHDQLRDIKRQSGKFRIEYEATIGKVGTFYLKCKNPACDAFIQTDHKGTVGTNVRCPPSSVACPACGYSDLYDGSNFQLRLAEK